MLEENKTTEILTISPKTVALTAFQTQAFEATINGAAAKNVEWSIDPPGVGSISQQGVYTSPQRVYFSRQVTVNAKSGASTATATVEITSTAFWTQFLGAYFLSIAALLITLLILLWNYLCPNCKPPDVEVSPPIVTLTASQPQYFLANTKVTWSNPVSGNGLYTAPSEIKGDQSVIVTATSGADPKKTGSAVVIHSPDLGLSLQPQNTRIVAGGKVDLTAIFTVAPGKEKDIDISKIELEWLQPPVGTLSPATGPASQKSTFQTNGGSVSRPATVTLLAKTKTSPPRTAGAYVTILPASKAGKAFGDDCSHDAGSLLALIALMGALGGIVHGTSSFAQFVGNREFKTSWTWWYILKPFLGATVALIVYLVIRAGFGSGDFGLSSADCMKVGAFAGLIGLFAEPATLKLRDIFDVLFTPKQDSRKDAAKAAEGKAEAKATSKTAPHIETISPMKVKAGTSPPPVLKITGSNFSQECMVKIGAASRKPTSISNTQVEVQLLPDDVATPRTVAVIVYNSPPDGDPSNSMSLEAETA